MPASGEALRGRELPPLKPKYRKQVSDRLDEVLAEARRRSVQSVKADAARIVIMSDHHKGGRNKADDFQRCERAYCAALGSYLEAGFKLFLLGDAEELWEEDPETVLGCYPEVFALEAEFGQPGAGGLVRFFGNHDDLWQQPKQVKAHLSGIFGAIDVREAMLLTLTGDDDEPIGEILFAHGHQGTTESDRYGRWARLPVRYLWRPLQRKLGFSMTTPASDFGLRGTHDRALFEWVSGQRGKTPLVLITGHTHRPVFSLPPMPTRVPDLIQSELTAARAAGDQAAVARLRAELEHARAIARDPEGTPLTVDPPCYFNTGCCSFPDGDITALEIADGQIRLVRWPDDDQEPNRRELGCKPLREVFQQVTRTEPGQETIMEHPL